MSALEVAAAHARDRVQLAERLRLEAERAWARVDPAHISETWAREIPGLLALMTGGQALAASSADEYVSEALGAQGIDPAAQGRLEARSLAGIASDGRPLESLLAQPGIAAKVALAGGETLDRAMTAGSALSQLIAHTQVADAGRVADGVAMTARPHAAGYVRVVVGATCSRCIVLAGRWYRWNAGFNRHPKCDCIGIPARESMAGDLITSPRKVFDSLSAAEQDRVFTQAGADAIRSGADMGKVVNARRGMFTADGKLYTREAAGRRPRIMPEQIFRDATSRDDAIRLLRSHGYLTGEARTVVTAVARPASLAAVPAAPFEDRLAAAAKERDALAASRFGLDRRPRPQELTPEMARAINAYTGAEYNAINRQLRGLPLPYGYEPADVLPTIAGMDRALAASHLDRDVVVYRGVLDASQMFGSRLSGDLTGMQWREDAYLSTTARKQTAGQFAGKHGQAPMQMRIVVPKGTPAIEASGMNLEAELLLGRGQRLRIVADRGIGPDGVRHVDVEVIR